MIEEKVHLARIIWSPIHNDELCIIFEAVPEYGRSAKWSIHLHAGHPKFSALSQKRGDNLHPVGQTVATIDNREQDSSRQITCVNIRYNASIIFSTYYLVELIFEGITTEQTFLP